MFRIVAFALRPRPSVLPMSPSLSLLSEKDLAGTSIVRTPVRALLPAIMHSRSQADSYSYSCVNMFHLPWCLLDCIVQQHSSQIATTASSTARLQSVRPLSSIVR